MREGVFLSLVVFTDARGERWRVWNVSPSALRRSEYLGAEYRAGWLCFESESSGERRRLASAPDDWTALAPARLELLLKAAAPVTRRTVYEPDADAGAP
jgi:hypothetical protein